MMGTAGNVTAVIDACVLASVLRRDFTLSLAFRKLYNPRCSAQILDETERAIQTPMPP